ncbi:M28 family metallopeptidase [Amniculibacterium aquaticum]|uniref:M28 family metallopeptidase n=1 Tax=Amniculibacterium aquaticum TaxID=2479858 RepID=UPI000F593C3F|nr:M28 family metallopeptidase [Amniculibacterium aquaticum]
MKRVSISVLILLGLVSCKTIDYTTNGKAYNQAYESIKSDELKKNLFVIASDEMEGRDTGSKGQKKAGDYVINYYKDRKIGYPEVLGSYFQKVPAEYMNKKSWNGKRFSDSDNILAFIKGSEKPNEIVVISAHYDHIGTKNGVVYNGADDDGSGTVAVMEIAEAFKLAEKKGHGPKRSILFMHATGEEHGLFGSSYYVDHPVFPLENTVTNLNIDMIGRCDPGNCNQDYVYVIGSEMLSSELKMISEAANNKTYKMKLDYKYDDPKDPNRLYYRSDHYNFAKNGIPVAFYFDGIHEDYHKETDDPEKIDYELLKKRTQLIFSTAWELANRKDRIVVDKKH